MTFSDSEFYTRNNITLKDELISKRIIKLYIIDRKTKNLRKRKKIILKIKHYQNILRNDIKDKRYSKLMTHINKNSGIF